ncbi:hypothetical protein D3C81_1855490 [compost metagenome]
MWNNHFSSVHARQIDRKLFGRFQVAIHITIDIWRTDIFLGEDVLPVFFSCIDELVFLIARTLDRPTSLERKPGGWRNIDFNIGTIHPGSFTILHFLDNQSIFFRRHDVDKLIV